MRKNFWKKLIKQNRKMIDRTLNDAHRSEAKGKTEKEFSNIRKQ